MMDKKLTLLHITHPKAGSQWIYKILQACAPEKIVNPNEGLEHLLQGKILNDKIYPTLYNISYSTYIRANVPANVKPMVVIRDLRDTLISQYFSMKISHTLALATIKYTRKFLIEMSVEEGLMFLMDHFLPTYAVTQFSWYCVSESLIKYENLLQSDVDILTPIISQCYDLPEEKIKKIIIANRFEALTQRNRGEENLNSHERKGIAGDWKNYFTTKIKNKFKNMYGDLLLKTGYEKDNNW